MQFQVTSTEPHSGARCGKLENKRAIINTPCFMPVGTQGALKGMTNRHLEECGAQIMLANSYHLHLRPGDELVRELGGLHKFMGWHRAILTDSGGFQVFSLAPLNKITADGVEFQSHLDGSKVFMGPAESIKIQENLGADIIMAFDECPPYQADAATVRRATERTLRWAKRCLDSRRRPDDCALFLIGQGGFDEKLRAECMQHLVEMDAPGYAIGGVSVGEPGELGRMAAQASIPHMPAAKPRYLMGVGTPLDILNYVALGIDMFDCVMPTRNGRNGSAFTRTGPLKIRNQKYRTDTQPLDVDCTCYVCKSYTRAYLRHLSLAKEINAITYLTYHNIYFYFDLMREIRLNIQAGAFTIFKQNWTARFQANSEPDDADELSSRRE